MLPARIAGIGLGEALPDGERGAVGLEAPRQIALFHEHVADPTLRDRQIALPARIAGIGLGEALERLPGAGEQRSPVAQLCPAVQDTVIQLKNETLSHTAVNPAIRRGAKQ